MSPAEGDGHGESPLPPYRSCSCSLTFIEVIVMWAYLYDQVVLVIFFSLPYLLPGLKLPVAEADWEVSLFSWYGRNMRSLSAVWECRRLQRHPLGTTWPAMTIHADGVWVKGSCSRPSPGGSLLSLGGPGESGLPASRCSPGALGQRRLGAAQDREVLMLG